MVICHDFADSIILTIVNFNSYYGRLKNLQTK